MEPFIGEIRIFGGNYAPVGWLLCDGSTVYISQYEVLYNLIGTTYGGDGIQTFAVPDLRGRVRVGQSPTFPLGTVAGSEVVGLTTAQLPKHNHGLVASAVSGGRDTPALTLIGPGSTVMRFRETEPAETLDDQAIAHTGGGAPHENRQPYLAITHIIAADGVYPPPPEED